jgi:hypothetical protein
MSSSSHASEAAPARKKRVRMSKAERFALGAKQREAQIRKQEEELAYTDAEYKRITTTCAPADFLVPHYVVVIVKSRGTPCEVYMTKACISIQPDHVYLKELDETGRTVNKYTPLLYRTETPNLFLQFFGGRKEGGANPVYIFPCDPKRDTNIQERMDVLKPLLTNETTKDEIYHILFPDER